MSGYDIQKNASALVEAFRKKVLIKRHVGYFIELEVAGNRVDIDYLGKGIWGVDPTFTSSMVCYAAKREKYADFMLILSEFNVKSHKRYLKA